MDDYVWIDARYPGKCAECATKVEVNDRVLWEPDKSKVYCEDCAHELGEYDE